MTVVVKKDSSSSSSSSSPPPSSSSVGRSNTEETVDLEKATTTTTTTTSAAPPPPPPLPPIPKKQVSFSKLIAAAVGVVSTSTSVGENPSSSATDPCSAGTETTRAETIMEQEEVLHDDDNEIPLHGNGYNQKLDASFKDLHDQLQVGGGGGGGSGNANITGATSNNSAATKKHHQHQQHPPARTWCFVTLILLVGIGVSSAFWGFGISQVQKETHVQFSNQALGLIQSISQAWTDFEVATLWIHNSCRSSADQVDTHIQRGICTRDDFDELYEYLLSTGLEFQAITWLPNCTHDERPYYEQESLEYYQTNYPDVVNYTGFKGLEPDPNSPRGFSMLPRSNQSFYFPAHYVLPASGFNLAALDFDLMSSPTRRAAVEMAIQTHEPALTVRLELLDAEAKGYSVILFHPGIPLLHSQVSNPKPQELALMVININDLIVRSVRSQAASVRVVLYDMTDTTADDPLFLGGADVSITDDENSGERIIETTFFKEDISLSTLLKEKQQQQDKDKKKNHHHHLIETQILNIGSNRQWKAVVVPFEGTYKADTLFVAIGGSVILVACIALAVWFYWNLQKERQFQQLQVATEAEKAQLIVESAHKTAVAERELNDFIAHEVRNPLAAAMSACSFVSTAINEQQPLSITDEANNNMESVREDVDIIQSSLQYINDLLRNMLDWHRVMGNGTGGGGGGGAATTTTQLNIELAPTDILRDVLEPTATMLYRRGDDFEVILDCQPPNLVVMTDRMRLKQIVLNFAMNSRKFVEKGFIKLRADVDHESNINHPNVKIYIEDTGPGIPMEKRQNLFAKFQDSLDSLNQGTGIGLSLCKKLSQLMNGDVYLDEDYDSGREGCPGTRFVIDLNANPMDLESDETLDSLEKLEQGQQQHKGDATTLSMVAPDQDRKLPENYKVLFVDDDLVLRKLFSRSLKRIAPTWNLHEASNGETAIRLCEEQCPCSSTSNTDNDAGGAGSGCFDLIFMDQYMASVEKQLLGTETVRALRANGVESRVCGLSANDAEDAFLRAGANAFMFKPFPCEREALTREILRILYEGTTGTEVSEAVVHA